MPDELEKQVAPTQQGDAGAAGSSGPSYDPQEIEYLRNYHAQTRPVLEKLSPVWEDAVELADNEQMRGLWKSARESYKTLQEKQTPEIPPYVKEQNERLGKLTEYVDTLQKQQTLATLQSSIAELGKKYTKLADNNYELVGKLAQDAAAVGMTDRQFVDYLTRVSPYLAQAAGAAAQVTQEKPPTSLRNDASIAGAPEKHTKPSTRKEFVRDLTRKLRAGGM